MKDLFKHSSFKYYPEYSFAVRDFNKIYYLGFIQKISWPSLAALLVPNLAKTKWCKKNF